MLGGIAGARGLWCSRGGLPAQRALLSTAAGARPARRRQLAPRKAAMSIVRRPPSATEHVPERVCGLSLVVHCLHRLRRPRLASRSSWTAGQRSALARPPSPVSPFSHAFASFTASRTHSPLVACLQPGAQGIQLGVKQRGCNGLSTPSFVLLDLVHTITSPRRRRLARA